MSILRRRSLASSDGEGAVGGNTSKFKYSNSDVWRDQVLGEDLQFLVGHERYRVEVVREHGHYRVTTENFAHGRQWTPHLDVLSEEEGVAYRPRLVTKLFLHGIFLVFLAQLVLYWNIFKQIGSGCDNFGHLLPEDWVDWCHDCGIGIRALLVHFPGDDDLLLAEAQRPYDNMVMWGKDGLMCHAVLYGPCLLYTSPSPRDRG